MLVEMMHIFNLEFGALEIREYFSRRGEAPILVTFFLIPGAVYESNAATQHLRCSDDQVTSLCYHTEALPSLRLVPKLPFLLARLTHLVEYSLGNLHSLHASRDTAVGSAVKDRFPDLKLCQAIVPRSTNVDSELWPTVKSHKHTNVQ